MSALAQFISSLSGAASFKSTQQTLSDPNSSTLDAVLSVTTTALTLVTVGASVVALGAAAVAGGAEIALAAGAVASYTTIAGLVVGSASLGNDLYNVATYGYGWATSQNSGAQFASAATTLVADAVVTYLNAEGVGGLAAPVGKLAESALEGVFVATTTSNSLQAVGLVTSVADLLVQSALSSDATAATNSIQSAAPSDFGQVEGTVNISNSQGPILSGLTGVGVGDNGASPVDVLTSIAAPDGTYNLLLPIGIGLLPYNILEFGAFDPVSLYDPNAGGLDILASASANLSAVNPTSPSPGPDLAGSCNDTDAGSPDADDPDCD